MSREDLKEFIFQERGGFCELCGLTTSELDMHEGIVTRKDIIGWKGEKKNLIFTKYNVFLLCSNCHLNKPKPRDFFWQLSVNRYGEQVVRDWYQNLPFKSQMRQF